MDDTFSVCHVDGTGEDLEKRGRLVRRPGLAVETVGQAAPLDPLQRQERPTLVASNLVDLHDVGMPYPGRQLRLQPKSELLGAGSEFAGQHHLQGCQSTEAAVPRLVHDPHASAADLGQDLVLPDLAGGRQDY